MHRTLALFLVSTLAAASGAAQQAAGAPFVWTNLGPFAAPPSFGRDIDSGRLTAIVALPGNVLLVASVGGVFRCLNADPASSADWVWTPVTDNLPGPPAAVAAGALAASADGTTLYLGLGDPSATTSAGFFRSTDLGGSWTAASVPPGPFRSYAICPLSPQVVLWATNAGLLRSSDGGASFQTVAGPLGSGQVRSVASFTATDLAACQLGNPAALYWSADAGVTWTAAALDPSVTAVTGPGTLGRVSFAVSPADPSQGWGLMELTATATSPDRVAQGLLHTGDRGHTWSFVAPDNPSAHGTLFHGSGKDMAEDGQGGGYNQVLAVDPRNPLQVAAGANLATYRTLDGGASWAQLTEWEPGGSHPYLHADGQCAAWSPDGRTLYLGSDGGLSVLKDPWRSSIPSSDDLSFLDNGRNLGLCDQLVYSVSSTLATDRPDSRWEIVAGTQDLGTCFRDGSGAALATSGVFDLVDVVGDGTAGLYHPANSSLVLFAGQTGAFFLSTDGGLSSRSDLAGLPDQEDPATWPFFTPLIPGLADPSGNTVYTASLTTVYRSRDFGFTWQALPGLGLPGPDQLSPDAPPVTLSISALGASPSDPLSLALATFTGQVFLSRDGGAAWTPAGPLPACIGGINDLRFDPDDPAVLYVASNYYSPAWGHLWRSGDGGVSFNRLDLPAGNGLPAGIPVHAVRPDLLIPGRIYAGTDAGAYVSGDSGATWTPFGAGLPRVAVRDFYLAPDGSFIRAATYGRGLWEIATPSGSTLTLTAAPSTQVAPGGSVALAATVTGPQASSPVAWSDGGAGGGFVPATTLSGQQTVYTAPPGPLLATVTARSTAPDPAAAVLALQVYAPAAVAVAVTPAAQVLVTGGTFSSFQATVAGAPTREVTWSASSGSIDPTGEFIAPAQPLGSAAVTITATSPYGGAAGTATVTVKSLDLDGDGVVDLADFAFLAYRYGTAAPEAKLTGGAIVDDADLLAFLAAYR